MTNLDRPRDHEIRLVYHAAVEGFVKYRQRRQSRRAEGVRSDG